MSLREARISFSIFRPIFLVAGKILATDRGNSTQVAVEKTLQAALWRVFHAEEFWCRQLPLAIRSIDKRIDETRSDNRSRSTNPL